MSKRTPGLIKIDRLSRPHSTAYLCGHPSMIETGKGILQRAGWKKESMFEEVYFQPGKELAVAD